MQIYVYQDFGNVEFAANAPYEADRYETRAANTVGYNIHQTGRWAEVDELYSGAYPIPLPDNVPTGWDGSSGAEGITVQPRYIDEFGWLIVFVNLTGLCQAGFVPTPGAGGHQLGLFMAIGHSGLGRPQDFTRYSNGDELPSLWTLIYNNVPHATDGDGDVDPRYIAIKKPKRPKRGFTCNCPDFKLMEPATGRSPSTQIDREWVSSNAGSGRIGNEQQFCKHIHAVRRHLGLKNEALPGDQDSMANWAQYVKQALHDRLSRHHRSRNRKNSPIREYRKWLERTSRGGMLTKEEKEQVWARRREIYKVRHQRAVERKIRRAYQDRRRRRDVLQNNFMMDDRTRRERIDMLRAPERYKGSYEDYSLAGLIGKGIEGMLKHVPN